MIHLQALKVSSNRPKMTIKSQKAAKATPSRPNLKHLSKNSTHHAIWRLRAWGPALTPRPRMQAHSSAYLTAKSQSLTQTYPTLPCLHSNSYAEFRHLLGNVVAPWQRLGKIKLKSLSNYDLSRCTIRCHLIRRLVVQRRCKIMRQQTSMARKNTTLKSWAWVMRSGRPLRTSRLCVVSHITCLRTKAYSCRSYKRSIIRRKPRLMGILHRKGTGINCMTKLLVQSSRGRCKRSLLRKDSQAAPLM